MSVWSDPRIIKITEKFIPTTDEVYRLQRAVDLDAIRFQNMAKQGHYKKEGGTRQGIYVCTPNGNLLSSTNSLNPDIVLDVIKDGLEKWKDLSSAQRNIKHARPVKASHRWEHSYPLGGLVLRSSKVDLLDDHPNPTKKISVGILIMFGSVMKRRDSGFRILSILNKFTSYQILLKTVYSNFILLIM